MNRPQQIKTTQTDKSVLFWNVACGAFRKKGTYFPDIASAAAHFKEAQRCAESGVVEIVNSK